MVENLINNVSEDFILEQGELTGNIICENNIYSYETGEMRIESAVFKINMQGGYYMFDGEGGAISKCPACGKGSLLVW